MPLWGWMSWMAEAVEQSDHSKVRKWLEKKASSLRTQTLNGADAEMQTWLIYFAIHHLNSLTRHLKGLVHSSSGPFKRRPLYFTIPYAMSKIHVFYMDQWPKAQAAQDITLESSLHQKLTAYKPQKKEKIVLSRSTPLHLLSHRGCNCRVSPKHCSLQERG